MPMEHSWKDLQGNKYNKAPKLEMLDSNGYRCFSITPVTGEKKSDRTEKVIVYNRDYVITWFGRCLLDLKLDPNQLRELLEDIYSAVTEVASAERNNEP